MKILNAKYLSVFCRELGLLLSMGFCTEDSLIMLRDRYNDKTSKKLMDFLYESAESGKPLSLAMEDSGVFPKYMTGTIRLGEDSGKIEESFSFLSEYYRERNKLSISLRRALYYPLILVSVMVAVVIVLLTQVIPVFNKIYIQVGTQMTGSADSLFRIGKGLSSASAILMSIFALILFIIIIVYNVPFIRRFFLSRLGYRFGDKGFWGEISAVKFASAMSMAVSSGIDTNQAVFIAGSICNNCPGMSKKMVLCKELLDSGEKFDECICKARILPKKYIHLLFSEKQLNTCCDIITEASRAGERKIAENFETNLKKLEPVLILISTLIIGLMLFSVILPMIGVMSTLS